MGDEIRLRYVPREGATPENEARVLVEVYRFVLRIHEEKEKGASSGTSDNAKEVHDVRADERILSQQQR
jgi:hypothetical protein